MTDNALDIRVVVMNNNGHVLQGRHLPQQGRIHPSVPPSGRSGPGRKEGPAQGPDHPGARRTSSSLRIVGPYGRCSQPTGGERESRRSCQESQSPLRPIVRPRSGDAPSLEESGNPRGDRRGGEEGDVLRLRRRSRHLPDGRGQAPRSQEQTGDPSVGGDGLLGRRGRGRTPALLPCAGGSLPLHGAGRGEPLLPGEGSVHPFAGPSLLRHHLGVLRGGGAGGGSGPVRILQGQATRPPADDRGRGADQGRDAAGSSRFPREHAGRNRFLGGHRRDEEPLRDQARDPGGRPRDVQREDHLADRGTFDGVHRRGPDAYGVGRPGDRARKQRSLRGGVRKPQGEEGRAGREEIRRLPQRGGGQAGQGGPRVGGRGSSEKALRGNEGADRQLRLPEVRDRRKGRGLPGREEDRRGPTIRREVRPAHQHGPLSPGNRAVVQGAVAGGAGVPGDQDLPRNPPDASVARGSCSGTRGDVLPGVLPGDGSAESSSAQGRRGEARRRSREGAAGNAIRPLARRDTDFPGPGATGRVGGCRKAVPGHHGTRQGCLRRIPPLGNVLPPSRHRGRCGPGRPGSSPGVRSASRYPTGLCSHTPKKRPELPSHISILQNGL